MSTWMHLVCLDHDPPLVAEEESGQHHYDLPRIRKEIAERQPLVERWNTEYDVEPFPWADGYFTRNSARFLSAHKACRIGIRDEYGVDHPTEDES